VLEGGRPNIPKKIPKHLNVPDCDKELILTLITESWDQTPDRRPTAYHIVQKLTMGIVPKIFGSNVSVQFEQMFKGEDVPNFLSLFSEYLGMTVDDLNSDYELLKSLLMEKMNNSVESVTKVRFSMFLEWFGPFENKNSYQEMIDLCKNPWFFGLIDRDKAEDLLKKSDKGTFLVRLSKKLPDFAPYVLTHISKSKSICHTQIKRTKGKLVVGVGEDEQVYAEKNLQKLIHKLKKEKFIVKECAQEVQNNYQYKE